MIRVLIERRCLPGKEARLRELLVQIRAAAMRRVGFISGETLRSADDPSVFLTVGTWTTREAWKAWDTTPERWEIASVIEPLLSAPEKLSVYHFVDED